MLPELRLIASDTAYKRSKLLGWDCFATSANLDVFVAASLSAKVQTDCRRSV